MEHWKTQMPDPRVLPRSAGVATFCRYPRLEDVGEGAHPVDWAIYGCAYDGGVSYRSGARFGPRAIREASQYVKAFHVEHSIAVPEVLSLADAGDAPIPHPFSCESTLAAIAAWASEIPRPGSTRLLAVGGDHSIALANLRATRARNKAAAPLALIHFDAHVDTLDSLWGERYSHASPFRRAFEERLVDPARMISIGVRGPINTRDDFDEARALGVTLVTYEQWRWGEGAAIVADFVRRLGGAPTYLSFDIDCVDPAFAPGTGTPAPGGFTSQEVLRALRSLAGIRLAGADVVEVLPDRDASGITAFLAAHALFEILALDALRASKA